MGLVRQGRTADRPRVIDRMIQVIHPSNASDYNIPWPVAHIIPPIQNSNQKKSIHTDDDENTMGMIPRTREGLIPWIQNTAFPEPPVALDCCWADTESLDPCSSSDYGTDVLNDAFGESPGYVPVDTTWSTDSELGA